MWIIRDAKAIDDFERRNGIVSIYIDNGYNPRISELFNEMARAFDENAGPAWHLLIPVNGGYVRDGEIGPNGYNIPLARQIAEDRDIKPNKWPALVFEFIPKREYYALSLAGMSEDRIRKIVAAIGEIAREEFREGNRDLSEFRAVAHGRIVRYLVTERAIEFVAKVSPALAGLIASAASVKAFTG